MAEQFHDRSKAHTGTEHFGPVGMPQLMRDDTGGQSCRVTDQMQVIAKAREKRNSRSMPGQKSSVIRQRIQRTKEAQSMNEITGESIDRDHAFRFELAQGYVDGPLARAYGVQAVIREVNALSDAHAGVSKQEEDICGEIVAPHQLLLKEQILLCGERAGQALWRTGNILAPYQVSKFSKLVCPGQLVQDGAQSDKASDAGCRSQRRISSAQMRHPSEEMRIAAELFETSDLRMFGAEISEETTHCDVVVALGSWAERGGDGLNSVREGRRQWMLERRAAPAHQEILGFGWVHCFAARAYCR